MRYITLAAVLIVVSMSLPASSYGTPGSFEDLSGNAVPFNQYEGTPVMIEAIQTSCGACDDSEHRQKMNAVFNEFSSDVIFLLISINPGDNTQTMNAFMDKHSIQWFPGLDSNNVLTSSLGVTATPTTVLLGADGEKISTWVGHQELNTYVNALNGLLGQSVTIEDTFSGGGAGSSGSIIENVFSNPFFQGGLIIAVVLLIYVKSSGSGAVAQ